MTRHNLGDAYAQRARDSQDDDLGQAIKHLKGALEFFAGTGLPVHQRATGQTLGDAYARLGDHWNEALAAYESALAAADALYVTSFSRSARQAELSETPALHRNAAYAAAKAGKRERAAVIAERGRARGLGDARARDQAELGQIREDLANEFLGAAKRLQDLEAAEWLAPAMMPVPGTLAAAAHETRGQDFRESLGEARVLLADAISRIRHLDGHAAFLSEPEFADIAATVCQAGPLAYLAACAEGSLTLLVTQPEDVTPAGGQPEARVDVVPEHAQPLTAAALRALVIDSGSADKYLPAHMEMKKSAQPEATRSKLLGAAAEATHIHFACHGIFDALSPADSALLLSQDGRPDPLTLRDIMASRPFSEARLVVASACQTAVTDFMDTPDEVIGLPAGFLSAGTPGMVGTLWPVNDVSTALLMCRFYELHLGCATDQPTPLSPAQALRKAQLWLAQLTTEQLDNYHVQDEELRNWAFRSPPGRYTEGSSAAVVSSSERPFAHPYHWASSVFVGA